MTASENIWSYRDHADKDLSVLTLLTGIISCFAVLLLHRSAEAVFGALLFATIISVVLFLVQSRSISVEIDKDKGTVAKRTTYGFITIRKRRDLKQFAAVKLLGHDAPIDGEYRLRSYSIALTGPGLTLELFPTSNEQEGKAVLRKLSEFTGLPAC